MHHSKNVLVGKKLPARLGQFLQYANVYFLQSALSVCTWAGKPMDDTIDIYVFGKSCICQSIICLEYLNLGL